MTENTPLPASSEECCTPRKCCCRFMGWVGALILVIAGTGMLAQWNAWASYKKYSADEYNISVISEKGDTIEIQAQHYIKLYRNMQRVDVVANDKKARTCYYNFRTIKIVKK